MVFIIVNFWAPKRKPVTCKSDGAFQFSHFLVLFWLQNHRKSFYKSCKIFYERKPHCTHLDFKNVIVRTKRVIQSRQYCSILPAWVASQSTGFGSSCLAACGVCHIIKLINNSSTLVDLYRGLQRCSCDSNTTHWLVIQGCTCDSNAAHWLVKTLMNY